MALLVVFAFNTLLFAAALLISCVRYILWPKVWCIMIHDPHHSLFLGAVPIGFATIINMFFYVCVPAWGRSASYFGWGLWMLDAFAAVGTALLIPFMMLVHRRKGSDLG
jgi:tellurite resistance protein TehA-like permease